MIIRANLLWLVLLFTLISCKAKQAKVDQLSPQAIELKKYSVDSIRKESIRLVENTVFLWKPEGQMTSDQVRDIQALSKDLAQLEEDQRELEKPLTELKKIYDIALAKLDEQQKQDWNALPDKVAIAQETIDLNTAKLSAETDKLMTELSKLEIVNGQIVDLNKLIDEEKSKTEVDQEKLTLLSQRLSELEASKSTSEKAINTIKKKQKKYEDKIVEAKAEYLKYQTEKTEKFKEVNEAYEQIKREESRLIFEKQKMSDRGSDLIKKLTENVELLEKPSFLNIKAIGDQIQLDLSWKIHQDCSNCEENFSTENNNIQEVVYQEEGGLLKFVLIDLGTRYFFRLVRISGEKQDGRIFYSGDLILENADRSLRFGVLKFSTGKY